MATSSKYGRNNNNNSKTPNQINNNGSGNEIASFVFEMCWLGAGFCAKHSINNDRNEENPAIFG